MRTCKDLPLHASQAFITAFYRLLYVSCLGAVEHLYNYSGAFSVLWCMGLLGDLLESISLYLKNLVCLS